MKLYCLNLTNLGLMFRSLTKTLSGVWTLLYRTFFQLSIDVKNVLETNKQCDGQEILLKYEKCLRDSYFISGSLQEVLDGKINRNLETKNLVVTCLYLLMLPRYWFCCYLYTRDKETMKYYQYWMVDYLETLGLTGRMINLILATKFIPLNIHKLLFHGWKSEKKLAFLTGMLSISAPNHHKLIDEKRKQQFLFLMNKKVVGMKVIAWIAIIVANFFQILGCVLFITRISQSPGISIWALVYLAAVIFAQSQSFLELFTQILIFHVAVDYFICRVKSLVQRFSDLKTDFTEEKLSTILDFYNMLKLDISNSNSSLKYLISNICYGFLGSFACILSLFTIEMSWWMQVFFLAPSFTIISTEIYVGRLQSEIIQLYHQLNSVSVRVNQQIMCLRTRNRLRTAIKELGSEQRNGQFVVGLTDRSSGVWTTRDGIELTLTTCSLTLMITTTIYNK